MSGRHRGFRMETQEFKAWSATGRALRGAGGAAELLSLPVPRFPTPLVKLLGGLNE